jgi:hypothetical protein
VAQIWRNEVRVDATLLAQLQKLLMAGPLMDSTYKPRLAEVMTLLYEDVQVCVYCGSCAM